MESVIKMTITQIIGKDKYSKPDLLVKAKELKLKGYSTLTVSGLVDAIVNHVNSQSNNVIDASNEVSINIQSESIPGKTNKPLANKKKTIPKVLKNSVWDKYIGQDKGIGSCFSCQTNIDSKHFECGHVIAEQDGGDITLDNLRPVCSLCNKSMGTLNMHDFIQKLKSSSKLIDIRDIARECGFIFKRPEKKTNVNSQVPFIARGMYRNQIEYDDEILIKEINYSTINYDFLKTNKVYCREGKLKTLLDKYSLNNEDIISYFTIEKPYNITDLLSGFYKINIEKLISVIVGTGQMVIDADLQKINVRTRADIDKSEEVEVCDCAQSKLSFLNRNNLEDSSYSGWNSMNMYIINKSQYTCSYCGKIKSNMIHVYKKKDNTMFSW